MYWSTCILFTESKLVILDGERATILAGSVSKMVASGVKSPILVIRPGKQLRSGMVGIQDAVNPYLGRSDVPEVDIEPEDIATIFFTSGAIFLPLFQS